MPPDVRFLGQNAPKSFSAGLRPRPRWGSLQRSPDPLAGLKGSTSNGRGGDVGREGKGWKGSGRQGRGEGVEGKGREGRAPPIFYCTPQFQFSRNMPGPRPDNIF